MHLGCGSYRNILETRLLGTSIIENLPGCMRTSQIERQQLLRVQILYAFPPIFQPLRLGGRTFSFRFSDARFNFSGRDN
ncbi:hypothetical protein AC244_17350 [Ensifer adhaerens]|uniref:Uncharacterized protein n=1 Tax=Ensifer adhaerens TaxID=106592 RepID=A0A0L8BRV3_ENSAD|nr:hypothetical protein AC244_17350 [Ensifer adhaerens]